MLTKSVVDAHGPGHSLLTLDGWENLGRVLECDWSFTKRVHNRKEVDEPIPNGVSGETGTIRSSIDPQDDRSNSSTFVIGFIEKCKASSKEEDAH